MSQTLNQGWASLVARLVKNPSAMQETQVQSLGREDPLEKEMATHSSILAWKIPWTEEPGWLQFMDHKESDTTERLNHHHHTHRHALSLYDYYSVEGKHISKQANKMHSSNCHGVHVHSAMGPGRNSN